MLSVLGTHLAAPAFRGGAVGVDVFFALSGFLITGLLIREIDHRGQIGLRRFYLRRLIRLYPALLATLAIFLVPGLLLAGVNYAWASLFAAAYVTPIAQDLGWVPETALIHTWTLTVEEAFYLVWPAVLLGLAMLGMVRRSWWVVGGVGVIGGILGIYLEASTGTAPWYLRASSMLLGCAAAMLAANGRLAPVWAAPIGAVGVAAAAVFWTAVPAGSVATFAAGLSASVLISATSSGTGAVARVLAIVPLRWVGVVSYELYLVHQPLVILSNAMLRDYEVRHAVWMVAIAILSFALAAAIHYWLMPLQRRWRRSVDIGLGSSSGAGAPAPARIYIP